MTTERQDIPKKPDATELQSGASPEPPKACSMRRLGRHRENAPVADSVVEAVVGELRARSDFGLLKYKQPLARTDWTRKDRLIHALQETLDLAGYLMAEVVAEEERLSSEVEKVPNASSSAAAPGGKDTDVR